MPKGPKEKERKMIPNFREKTLPSFWWTHALASKKSGTISVANLNINFLRKLSLLLVGRISSYTYTFLDITVMVHFIPQQPSAIRFKV